MSFFEILGGMIAVGVGAVCIGYLKDKYPGAWRSIFSAVVFCGGLLLASEGDNETVRWMALFLPFVVVFAMFLFWKFMDDEKGKGV